MSGYTPIDVGVDFSGLGSSSFKKRKLRNFDGQLVQKFGESSLETASTALIKSPSKTAVGSEVSLPEVEGVTNRRNTSVFRPDVAMNPNIATPPANIVPSSELVAMAEVQPVIGGTSVSAPRPFVPVEQLSKTSRRFKFAALMKEHGVDPASYRASAAELEMAPIWHPRFGKDGDKVFSTESTLFYDENEALDFIKGVSTPRDDRFLERKNEGARHRSAQHYMVKALMLASRNDSFVESSSRRISKLEMMVAKKMAQVKSLNVQLYEERKKFATNNSMLARLNTQVEDIQKGWSEMKVQLAASQKDLAASQNKIAAFDQAFAAKSELVLDLTKQVANLQTESEAGEATQSELQRRLESVAAHYQVVIDREVSSYYTKGFEEGFQNGVKAQDFAKSEKLNELGVDPLTDSGQGLEVLNIASDDDHDQSPINQLPLGQSISTISAPENVIDSLITSSDPMDDRRVADEPSIHEPINASSESSAVHIAQI